MKHINIPLAIALVTRLCTGAIVSALVGVVKGIVRSGQYLDAEWEVWIRTSCIEQDDVMIEGAKQGKRCGKLFLKMR